jgi:hypothetical protein
VTSGFVLLGFNMEWLHKRKEETPFEEVLPEMLGRIAHALADGMG